IDPGVGTSRRILAAKCADHVFVLPNNGLLSHVLRSSPSDEIVELQDQTYWRTCISSTFHGRDVMAPVAAHLSLGVRLSKLGPPATDVALLDCLEPRFEERRLIGRIIRIDHFGNLITDIEVAHLRKIPTTEIIIRCNERQAGGICQAYGTHPSGALIALVGSQGHLELAIVNGNAAAQLDARISDVVTVAW
ncbi:MAG: SAM-dependent chlorinase/fluorinase, partial [Planctomycetia bacterium]|nr:SAM-dependent chlorinase/fluorinase [Planctomycetia bacterium]